MLEYKHTLIYPYIHFSLDPRLRRDDGVKFRMTTQGNRRQFARMTESIVKPPEHRGFYLNGFK
jgi:hypothetical protein